MSNTTRADKLRNLGLGLATVSMATSSDPANNQPLQIRFNDRRVLLSTQHLQVAAACME